MKVDSALSKQDKGKMSKLHVQWPVTGCYQEARWKEIEKCDNATNAISSKCSTYSYFSPISLH